MSNPSRARIVRHLADSGRFDPEDDDRGKTKISLAPPNQYDDSARRKMLEEKRRGR